MLKKTPQLASRVYLGDVIHAVLRINRCYFSRQHYPARLYSGIAMCLLRDMNYFFKYYLA